jgi:hypothetical protein
MIAGKTAAGAASTSRTNRGNDMSDRFATTVAAAACAAVMGGCMLGPTDGERVSSTSEVLDFYGYDNEASGLVQVSGWDFTTHALAPIGPAVRADTSGITPAGGNTLYEWSASQALAPRFWHAGPAGGSCAIVRPRTTHADGNTYDMITVDDDWADCWDGDPNTSHFYENCRSAHSPLAMLYTNDWGNVTVGANPGDWSLVNALASGGIHITFDNFQPVAFADCNDNNPAGCPQGLPAGYPTDANTYKFFLPDGGSIVAPMMGATTPYMFSINPVRQDPMTIYIDNMQSSSIDFHVANGKLVLGINFTDSGPELRMNCINNFICAFVDGTTITFAAPRAEVTLGLAVVGGHVQYTDVSTTFTTGNSDSNSIAAAAAIAQAITAHLSTDAGIKTQLDGALDLVVRVVGRLGLTPPELGLDALILAGNTMTVQPGCAEL